MDDYLFGNNYKNVTRISAVNPDQLPIDKDFAIKFDNNTKTLMACTTSHLEALYQTYLLYVAQNNSYSLVCEDDVRLLYNFDWTKLFDSAPADWAILQITNSNPNMINYLKEQWIASNGTILWKKRNNQCYSTGAYLVNAKKFKHVFQNYTTLESMSISFRFNTMSTFIRKCNKSDTSIGSRCRCNGGIKYQADKYIYQLGKMSNSYASTIPLANFLPRVVSEISSGHSKFQTKAYDEINKLYLEIKTKYRHLLPNYIF